VTRNNLEAAEEVVRQLRLRDIGGIIVIDFIDMVLEANRDLVLRRLTECLARDRTRHQVAEVTSLGLVQMTRKRVGGGLLEHFSTQCEHCRGRGVIVNTEPVADDGRGDSGRDRRADRLDSVGRRSRGGRGRRGDADDRGAPVDRGRAAVDVGAPIPVPEPVAARPVVAEPVPAEPAAVEPAAVEPAAVEPAAVEPVVEVEAPVVEPALPPDADGPIGDAPAVEPPTVAVPLGSAVLETAAGNGHGTLADPAADAVEEMVTERSIAARSIADRRNGSTAHDEEAADPAAVVPADAAPDDDDRNGQLRPRRRGRVTRTAGAPVPASGDAPTVAVVTVSGDAPAPAAPVPVLPQPEPTVVTRPRRVRRAASRPAGPPPAAEGVAEHTGNGGPDPV
jgi:ribonuclease E